MIGPLAGRPVVQLGFVVRDLEQAVERFGGDWQRLVASPEHFRDVRYRGGEAALDYFVALSKGVTPQLELIQPTGGPNVWQEWLDERGEGAHHYAVSLDSVFDVVPAMEAAGYPVVQSGRIGRDGEYAYFDTVAACGLLVEAIRLPPRLRS